MVQRSPNDTPQTSTFRWGFLSAAAVTLAVLVVGQVVGSLLRDWPPAQTAMLFLRGDYGAGSELLGALFTVMILRDWVLAAFFASAAVFLWLRRAALLRFLRTMQVGVTFISVATLAVFSGVIVPQIASFEDPEERVTAANYESNFRDFAWAESYFLYHMLHPYGIGMPEVEIPAFALEGLERFGRAYGEEERSNREKMMRASFASEPKVAAVEGIMRDYEDWLRRAFDVATFLELNRAYKSDWFATLMILIFSGVAANTFRAGMARKWLTIHKVGFFVTHVGIMVMLVGGLVSHLLTDRGILELWLGEPPRDTYYRHYRGDKFSKMPFSLGLESFARKEWKALEIHALGDDLRSRPPRYTLWPGREIPLDYTNEAGEGEARARLLLRVKELHDHAVVGSPTVSEGVPVAGEAALPVVALDVPVVVPPGMSAPHAGQRHTAYLSPVLSNQGYFDPQNRFRLVVGYGVTAADLFPDESGRVLGTLDVEVRTAPQEHPIPVPVRLGERFQAPGGYELLFSDATSDLDVRERDREVVLRGSTNPLPLEEQAYGVTAVWLDIYPPDGGEVERRLVLERIDAVENGLQEEYLYSDVIARLRWDRWSAPGPERFVLLYGPDREPELVSEDGTRTPLAAGDRLPLPGPTSVALQNVYHHAKFEKNISFREPPPKVDGFDAAFYQHDKRGVVLEVVYDPGTPDERSEEVRMSTSEVGQSYLWYTPDERFAVVFLENTEGFPYDWRSVLTVWGTDPDGVRYKIDAGSPKQREIRVNDYFKHGRYRFFQTNAKAEDPSYSGIGVVYDPGIPIVLAGMYTIILGTLLAFMVRPIVLARKNRGTA